MGPEVGLTADIEELPNGAAVLILAGEIDVSTASVIAPQFQVLADRGLTEVIVDTSQVSFMDSTGINALAEGRRIISEKGSKLVVVASRPVRRVLDLVFPEPHFAPRFDTIEEAMAELGLDHE